MDNKKIIAGAAAAVMLFGGGFVYTKYSEYKAEEHRLVLEQRQQHDEELAQKEATAAAEKDKKWDEFREKKMAESLKQMAESASSSAGAEKPKVTVNEDGTEVEITRPEYNKPEPPPKPEIPEDQKKDPNSKPEYKPEPPAPPSDKPKNGDERINADGEMEFYVKGFGWTKPTGGEVTYSDVELSGEKIGH